MGFFSGLRKRVKKLIPKEIRPFAPYIAAGMIPGGGGLMSLGKKFGAAGLTKYLSDDQADAKDILRSGIFAAAPDALSQYGASSLPGADSIIGQGAATLGQKAIDHPYYTIGAQGSIDAGIKAAELDKEALEKYNRDLAAQGIGDKTARRAAIRSIYANTGTWDMDEVDGMLDTYGYRTGGRVGYEGGNLVDMEDVILASTKGKKSEEETYFDEEGGDISMTKAVKKNIFERDEDDDNKDNRDSDLSENIEMAIDGYNRLYPEIKPASIRPLTFQDGGSVDDRLMERVKELQDEGLDFASALAQAMKEDMASGKAMGGIMDGIDVNMREQIDTPRGDMMIDENMEVADSSLMDAYEIYKFDMMEQGLEPMSLEEFREQAIAESKMASMKSRRTMAAEGGLMNLGGKEMDLRGGGFVPMGAKERADDVPARLSKNEFVMTADAVRAAGGGSVQKGADLMYDQMKQLEGQA
jgi:hypothetical protein